MKIRGRFLVFLLISAFFVAGCASVGEVKKPAEKKLVSTGAVSVVAEKPDPEKKEVIREVLAEKIVYKDIRRDVIGHYPIDVSDIRDRTKDDFDRIVQKFESLEPDAIRLVVLLGSCSHEASEKYNYDLGYLRAEKVKKALLEFFPKMKIITATRGERPGLRQVEVIFGASCADILDKVFRKEEGRLVFCDSVTFKVDPLTVTMTINLAQNNIKLEPGEKIRAHLMTKNHRFGPKDDVGAIGESDGNGRLVFRFPNLVASASGQYYIERIWFSTSEDEWFVPCSRYLEPDDKKNLAIQIRIYPDLVEPITADQFLDWASRSDDQPSKVYFEKKDEYYKK